MNVENAPRSASGTDRHTDWSAHLKLAIVASVFAALSAVALAGHVSETAIVISVIVLATMASWYQMERPVPEHALRARTAAEGSVLPKSDLKVRIGYGFGVRTKLNDGGFSTVVDELERLRFDSLWLSERIGGDAPDPLVAMAFAAGRTTKLKFGMSVMVLPGRNPIVLAKELATLDRLSNGRLLPAFGLGVADPHEQQAFGVERGERAALFDEAMAVLRAAWTGEPFTHHGARFHYENLRVQPAPKQSHIDVWLGGIAPSELRRVGRLGDGWLPSFVTPDDAARGREVIEHTLAEHGRSIDADHYGALIPYAFGPVPDVILAGLAKRRPDLPDPSVLIPTGWEDLRKTIDQFIAVGTTKFVVLPIVEPSGPDAWLAHLADAATELLPLQR